MAGNDVEAQLKARGLELLGPCGQLSQHPELLVMSALLRDFTPAEADLLGTCMLWVRARPGQLLMEEGEPSDWLMIVLSGTVDVAKRKVGAPGDDQEPGDTTRLAVLKEGTVVGEMSMLDGEGRYASCWALSEVEAAVLTRAAVGRLIATHPAVGAKLLVKLTQLVAQKLRNTSNQLVKKLQDKPVPPSGPGPEKASAGPTPSLPPPGRPGSGPSGESSR